MLTFDGTETVSCSSAGLMRREELLKIGGFDPALSVSADWDLLFRMALAGAPAYVDEPLVRYRVHGSNMSNDIAAMERDMTYAFGKAFAIRAFRWRYVSESDMPTLAFTGCCPALTPTVAYGRQRPEPWRSHCDMSQGSRANC